MNAEVMNQHELDDDEFDMLDALLTSEIMPADCMDVEMLDGYLAALLLSPEPVNVRRWMPGVWSADAEEMPAASGGKMRQAIRLVLRYYNEVATTLGQPDGWEPFCYANSAQGGELGIGDEWIEGFAQGLELWPPGWDGTIAAEDAEAVQDTLDDLMAPWEDEEAAYADDQTRLGWLDLAGARVKQIYGYWRAAGLPAPQVLPVDPPPRPDAAAAGRNSPCPCGSGEKYKKCCGNK